MVLLAPLVRELVRCALPERLRRVPHFVAGALFLDMALLFSFVSHQRDSDDAWLILTGSLNPMGGRWFEEVPATALAVAGYLFLPVMTGLIINVGLDERVNSQRKTRGEANRNVEGLLGFESARPTKPVDPEAVAR